MYGLATVLPRMISFLLVLVHTKYFDSRALYGEISVVFAYFVIFNVVLTYGMETAFFRFYSNQSRSNKAKVVNTSAWSLVITSVIILGLAFLNRFAISDLIQIKAEYLSYIIGILLFDVLVVIPFAYLRANQQPVRFAVIKVINVVINITLNLFFLAWLVNWSSQVSFLERIYVEDFQVSYVLIANLIASLSSLVLVSPFYLNLKFQLDFQLLKRMLTYAWPVLIAGLAFSINEVFDRILLEYLLDSDQPTADIGAYAACYKLAVFMTLFATAFRLGIEPFFFSHSTAQKPQVAYATITKYFVIFGAFILIAVVVFIHPLKLLIIRKDSYYEALAIVPILLVANFCLGIYHNLSVWYKVTDRTKFGAYISSLGAIITLVANFSLIPVLGYLGCAIATLAAYFTMMLLSYLLSRKYYPLPLQLKKMVLYFSLSVAISAVSFYIMKENYIFGILSILGFLALVYWNEHKEIKQLMKA
jgi:O-antigen/teichoic acid export membrane protein